MPTLLLVLAAAFADPGARSAPADDTTVLTCTAADGTVLGRHRWTHPTVTLDRRALCDALYPGGSAPRDATCADVEVTPEQWATLTAGASPADVATVKAALGAEGGDLVDDGSKAGCARRLRIKGNVEGRPVGGAPVDTTGAPPAN